MSSILRTLQLPPKSDHAPAMKGPGAALAPTLAQAMGVNGPRPTPAGHVQTQDGGKEAGGVRRPSDPSFFCPVPTPGVGIAMPKRDQQGHEIIRDRALTRKLRGLSL